MKMWAYVLTLGAAVVALTLVPVTQAQAVISLAQTTFVVREGDQFAVPIRRLGLAASDIYVVAQIKHVLALGSQDFIGMSQATVFPPGTEAIVRTLTFSVKDDDIPEPDESFIIELFVTNGNGIVGNPNSGNVVIIANDDGFGVFGFTEPAPVPHVVDEAQSADNSISLGLQRIRGTYGSVTVFFEVIGSGQAEAGNDLAPQVGSVIFSAGESYKQLQLQVKADQIPENDEEFQVRLTSTGGGESINPVANRPVINSSLSEALVTILQNDAPIRFSQAEYRADEGDIDSTLRIHIYRGLSADGTASIGPINKVAIVNYFFMQGLASSGVDYVANNGSVGFSPGATETIITVQIRSDTLPEMQEDFQIVLTNPTGDVVLATPNIATVFVSANDDYMGVLSLKAIGGSMYPSVHVNEDTAQYVSDFAVLRTGGTFGSVSVQWILSRNDSAASSADDDIYPTVGTVTFSPGEKEKAIIFTIVADNTPEPSERFTLQLLAGSVTGGAKAEGVLAGELIIEDSDGAYGIVEFTDNAAQSLVTGTSPRRLSLSLVRSGGVLGNVASHFNVEYISSSGIAQEASGLMLSSLPGVAVIPQGQSSHLFDVLIKDEAFLEVGALFRITLFDVKLSPVAEVRPYNTPHLGTTNMVTVQVSTAAANGEVGFGDTVTRQVQEPSNTPVLQVLLPVTREGTSGDVTIYWTLSGSGTNPDHVTNTDIRPFSGQLTMVSGQAMTNILVEVLDDSLAETDEEVTVLLTRVEPSSAQRLRPGAAEVKVLILENDGPGGVFEFRSDVQTSYIVQEEQDALQLTIIRVGGALVERSVEYYIEPNGEAEFYGSTNLIIFAPGEVQKAITVVATGDNIPELTEVFSLRLRSFGPKTALIGAHSTIQITVLGNDEPYGIFQFPTANYTVYVGESKGAEVNYAQVPIQRHLGRFGTASVEWNVMDAENNTDLSPLSGVAVFNSGIGEVIISIEARADKIPEDTEEFYVNLSRPTGNARIGHASIASVVIRKNDDAIYFREPATVYLTEGYNWTFTVLRSGAADFVARVKYRTVDGVATEGGRDYAGLWQQQLVFDVGETMKYITVETLNDTIPEPNEPFYIELYDAEGDIAIYGAVKATVIIQASNHGNGIFYFSPPFFASVAEGKTAQFEVTREQGIYGEARVYYEIFDNTTGLKIQEGVDFQSSVDFVQFKDLQQLAPLYITPLADNLPEYSEMFTLRLLNVSGGPQWDTGLVRSSMEEVYLEVTQNDYPYGVFAFPMTSREISIAEDFSPGQDSLTMAHLTVERQQGAFTGVQVAWEAFSYQIAGAGNLPTLKDLLFLGQIPPSVFEVPQARRPGTGTRALQFNGCPSCFVTVAAMDQTPKADIESGFSITAWVRPMANTEGYVVAKSSPDGARHYYALKLLTAQNGAASGATLEFQYSVLNNPNNLMLSRALSLDLSDGRWHLVMVCVENYEVAFYVDGLARGSSLMVAAYTQDGPGTLLVGAMAPGVMQYRGLLQDVRVYSSKLDNNEIRELYETPSMNDVVPISGYLTFPADVYSQTIVIQSIDDKEEEANDVFSVKLISATGGASVSDTDATSTLTVLKSDNANGMFGFSGPCVPAITDREDAQFNCPIVRQRGDADAVTLTWEVLQPTPFQFGPVLAEEDFVNATGTLVFSAGERQKTISFQALDDDEPELTEQFDVTLVRAMAADGLSGSTNISGASIDPQAAANRITLMDTDYPYGLLQFSMEAVPPQPFDPRIAPATKQPTISIPEEAGRVSLLVVRAQGLLGQVSVEWRTQDGTARSSGKTPADYMARVDRLTFLPGQLYTYVDVIILDNNLPESEKSFSVELVNPTGGAQVSVGSVITVTIQHSDQAYGVFQFAEYSLFVSVKETGDTGASAEQLKIVREGGAIGQANVTWQVQSDPNNDLVATSGYVLFQSGQKDADLTLMVRGDTAPELDETFVVQLTSVSMGIQYVYAQGKLGDMGKTSAQVVIQANDDPYGVFVISQQDRPIRVDEANTVVPIIVERTAQSGSFGTVRVDYASMEPWEKYPYLPGGTTRATVGDYVNVTASVIFSPGVMSATFNITIKDDTEPEVDETVFIKLTHTVLIQGSGAGQTNNMLNSPRLGEAARSYAQIIIGQNDSPNGVIQLTRDSVRVSEDFNGDLVKVVRTQGSYGSVSVKFEVVAGNASYGLDYSISSTDVVLISGERDKRLPVDIIDDRLPELYETFTIRLLDQVTGGATLGPMRECLVTIEPSDDPHGAFGFESTRMTVEEPTNSLSSAVEIPVMRTGGTVGVVAVLWVATINGQAADADISPARGTVYFVSNQARQMITVSVFADDVPEGVEDVVFTLQSATNAGRIIADKDTFTLQILPNDNPHGTVQFAQDNTVLVERDKASTQPVTLQRSGGSYGQLRVYYTTSELDLVQEATRDGTSVFQYYVQPLPGKPLPTMGTSWNVKGQPDPLLACAEFCLLNDGCKSFDYKAQSVDCNWYATGDYQYLDDRTGYVYYRKNQDMADPLYAAQAEQNVDYYKEAKSASVIIPDGASQGALQITILPDDLPELEEKFSVRLTSVELTDNQPTNPLNAPRLGLRQQATVSIASSDDANGVFRIYSKDPRALDNGQTVPVEERPKYSVELVVERQGGSIGTVFVSWFINLSRTTATKGSDFIADGATLTFQPGETKLTLTIGIEDDDLAEADETIVVELRDPLGGAIIGEQKDVNVLLMANDFVAGLLSFTQTSVIVKEGDLVTLNIARSMPALGRVTVDWRIEAVNSQPPQLRFRMYQGNLFFDQGEQQKIIQLHVLVDNQPKINQEYNVQLYNIRTEGVRETGAAGVDPQKSVAVLTIEGGNEPHGVFGFAPNTLERRVDEHINIFQIRVDRKFGSIGIVRVFYDIKGGAVRPLGENMYGANSGSDFDAVYNGVITVYNGENSGSISVTVVNDTVPEVDEIFIVVLTRVELIEPIDSTFRPKLASYGTTAEIIINANDGTQGEVLFSPQSASLSVDEYPMNLTLTIQRTMGVFGAVSVFCFAQSSAEGATRGEDFNFSPQDIHFGPGESQRSIIVEILGDTIPEPDEVFEIILASPKDGLTLGTPSKAIITIIGNDQANGIVNFETTANVTINEPNGQGAPDNSRAALQVIRAPGIYGVVSVPFKIISASGQDPALDVQPTEGVVTFQDKQAAVTLVIVAIADDVPEEAEVYYVSLLMPEGGATLGTRFQKTLIIERNDAPYGLVDIYPTGTKDSSLSVEESVGTVYFDVIRSHGAMGQVSVDLITSSGTARSSVGTTMHLSLTEQIKDLIATGWYSFQAYGSTFIVLLNDQRVGQLITPVGSSGAAPVAMVGSITASVLYRWQGVLVKVQTIETDGAKRATSFTIGGIYYLFVANAGTVSRHAAKSRLYRVNQDGSLFVVQDFSTRGANDAAYFMHNGQHYLMVANYQNNQGATNVLSDLYHWQTTNRKFSSLPVQYVSTTGAVAMATMVIEGQVYLGVASYSDSNNRAYELSSVVYRMDQNAQLTLHQQFSTKGAVDVASFQTATDTYLLLANSRDNLGNTAQGVQVLSWNSLTKVFSRIQEIAVTDAKRIHMFGFAGRDYLVIASVTTRTSIYQWDDSIGQFTVTWSTAGKMLDFYPITVAQPNGELVVLATAPLISGPVAATLELLQVTLVGESDFMPRSVTLTFAAGQTQLQTSVFILEDDLPEDTETFTVALTNPRLGVELGTHREVIINILSSDSGHGVIEFADDSVNRREEETPGRDNVVQLNVVRKRGTSGRVVVRWKASGDHQGIYDINPVEGQVEFADGQSAATISIAIRDDGDAEVDETSLITLLELLEKGTALPNKGAVIGSNNIARLTVLANDSPYGVVYWEKAQYMTTEPVGTASIVLMSIIRGQGSQGQISVTYMTQRAVSLPVSEQAVSGQDYVDTHSTIQMPDGVTNMGIQLTIKPDSYPEVAETFWVNITSVQLVGSLPVGGAMPSVRRPGDITSVTIAENDNARGMVQFSVDKNVEGRVDVYEGMGAVRLSLTRSVGQFGAVEVTWQALPREADNQDFSPFGGNVRFESGQIEAYINITIVDDNLPENLQTFDVQLISVTSGATLGPEQTVRVGILKNDSPNGVFSIMPVQGARKKTVKESKDLFDPEGLVSFDIIRRGTDGEVNVQWRLSPDALDDFVAPLTGTVHFNAGDTRKTLTLRTKPDNLLEGEESFTLSLVAADNNADISPTEGDATVVILADSGAGGTVSVLAQSRLIVIGEPLQGYNGTAAVQLRRSLGVYGLVRVTWHIVVRDLTAFVQTQGEVIFVDRQEIASIIVQTGDDSIPEPKKMFTLELTAATGGATINPLAKSAQIIVVASDYPYGQFEFEEPIEVAVEENVGQVDVAVVRKQGQDGQVRVHYTTTSGTALSDAGPNPDFVSTSGQLTFSGSQSRQVIRVRIVNDDRAEGPEKFYVNLTSVQLLYPLSINTSVINGLQMDQPPAIGPLAVKTVTINLSDDAEGFVQFDSSAMNFIAYEDLGEAKVPVIRGPGSWGVARARYRAADVTARANFDYFLPEGEVIFPDGVAMTTINVTIINDAELEFEEQFRLELFAAAGGTKLGQLNNIVVTIAKSDYPNGRFGFGPPTEVVMLNPQTAVSRTLAISRTGGLIGRQTLSWRIMGPNNPNRVLQETNDVGHFDQLSRETTSGVLSWEANEGGTKSFVLNVKPHIGWEIQKTFIISIYDIAGFPADAGSGEVDPAAGNFTMTIQKFGDPNGIVRFDSTASKMFTEPQSGAFTAVFPIQRTAGITGDIQVYWRVTGPLTDGNITDVVPGSGTATILHGRKTGQITFAVVADGLSELDENFQLELLRVEGGAELNPQYKTVAFVIRNNGYPHGRFGVRSADQDVVVVPQTLKRQVQLNVSRTDGAYGKVRLSFSIRYDQAQSGLSYVPSSGSVLFNDSVTRAIVHVDIESQVYIALGSTFTVTLLQATLIGVGVTVGPQLLPGQTVATVTVPQAAANSQVGFLRTVVNVDEATGLAVATVNRQGSYGSISIGWLSGYPGVNAPQGFRRGAVSPNSGTVSMNHAEDQQNITVQLIPQGMDAEYFTIHMPNPPTASVPGGARLLTTHTVCRLEPYGVIQFAPQSRQITVQERDDADAEVTLSVERAYGSQDSIQIRYNTVSGTAAAGIDFKEINSGAITMDQRQTTSSIIVQINKDSVPETSEFFYVNFTSVSRLPTSTFEDVSPRLSTTFSTAKVTISSNSDPYGVVSMEVIGGETGGRVSEPGSVTLSIMRSGGSFGAISVQVRTVGGGEPWDSFIVVTQGGAGDTIGEALGNRDLSKQALAGQDYQRLETTLQFQEGESQKTVMLYILDDTQPEGEEEVFVYLVPMTDGVRAAQPSKDNGRKGYVMLTVTHNDFWNGWVGFYAQNSTSVVADEDSGLPVQLTIERRNASFGELEIYWRAQVSINSEALKSPRIDLIQELVSTSGSVQCAAGNRFCDLQLHFKNDLVPENATWFLVELYLLPTQTGAGAKIDPSRRFANVSVLPNDNPNGRIQFKDISRTVFAEKKSRQVRLVVERVGYAQKVVMVSYSTQQLQGPVQMAGVTIYNALAGADYRQASGTLEFEAGVREQSIDIYLDPEEASDNPYPKMFNIILSSPTNQAELVENIASVTLVMETEAAVWDLWPKAQGPLNNDTIERLMQDLQRAIQAELNPMQLSLTKGILDKVLEQAEALPALQPAARSSVMGVFCKLLDPERGNDATRGQWELSKQFERFAYTFVADLKCDLCCRDVFIESPECPYAQFSVAKRYPEDINGHRWPARRGDYFTVPINLLRVQDHGRTSPKPKCMPVAFIDYSSDQWFTHGDDHTLLNNRVISAGVKDMPSRFLNQGVRFRIHTPDRRMRAKRAECMYFDEDSKQWTQGKDVCRVQNNLALALDDYVDCSCKHMSLYAVRSLDRNPSMIGYPFWFHVSCFICMTALGLVILAHHVCSIGAMFSTSIMMHMCFAVMATEICYVIDAFLSPSHILNVSADDNNYRCIVMSLFLHYFFLAQFTWMMTQAVNFFKILILNDEHTERNYRMYFMLGWGVPAMLVLLFYIITYPIYRFVVELPEDRIYGDVNNSGDICFVSNPYAGLAGVVAPVLVCLTVVVIIFIQAFQVQPQWQAYDDIYRGRYNIHEVRILLVFWALIAFTWLWGGLHMGFGQTWLFVFFCIFNIIMGIYAFVVYAILRNPWLSCFRPVKALYPINATISEVSAPPYTQHHHHIPSMAPESLRGSRNSLIQAEWEKESLPPNTIGSQLRVKRSAVNGNRNGNVYVIPPTPYEDKALSAADDRDTRDLDDLIYALKSEAVMTSPSNSGIPMDRDITTTDSSPGSQMERQRISIADTHL